MNTVTVVTIGVPPLVTAEEMAEAQQRYDDPLCWTSATIRLGQTQGFHGYGTTCFNFAIDDCPRCEGTGRYRTYSRRNEPVVYEDCLHIEDELALPWEVEG